MVTLIRMLVVQRIWWVALWLAYAAGTAAFLNAALGEIRQQSLDLAANGARNVFEMLLVTRQWNAQHGGVYVPVTARTPPNPYLDHPRRDVQTTDGQHLTMVNPAFMTRMISDLTSSSKGLSFRSVSLKPLNPDNAPDAWEAAALRSLSAQNSEVRELTMATDGRPVFRYMAPMWVTEDCLDCHREQGYRVGDLRGGISIVQDYAPFLAAAAPRERSSVAAHVGVLALLIAISGISLFLLRQSWLRLEDNIAELKQTRDELLQSEKMASLGRMVAGFAHELNTPVGIAVGAISHSAESLKAIEALLTHEEVDEARLRELLATLDEGGELALANLRRAASLVQRFKRSSIDQTTEQQRRFGVKETIDDIVFTLKNQLTKNRVKVIVDCPSALRVSGVPGLLDQVLTNLILNSMQHGFGDGSRPGSIHIVVTQPRPGWLQIEYSDDGAGLNDEVAAHIFEPFYTTRRGQGGTGLGMFLCYNIVVVQLGGSIHCSGSLGKGIRFDIRIPVEPASEKSAS